MQSSAAISSTVSSPLAAADSILPARSAPKFNSRLEIPVEETWNLSQLFANEAAWHHEFQSLKKDIAVYSQFNGQLNSPEQLYRLIICDEKLNVRSARLEMYARLSLDLDTSNQHMTELCGMLDSFAGEFGAARAFILPEILSLGQSTVASFIAQKKELAVYQHSFEDLFRQKENTRSVEVEEVLAAAATPLGGPEAIYSSLVDADLTFRPVRSPQGPVAVTNGTFEEKLSLPDRTVREAVWKEFYGKFYSLRNTFAGLYTASIQGSFFNAQQSHFSTVTEASLHSDNIPKSVREHTLKMCLNLTPEWSSYFELKRQALGLEHLKHWDIFAPLTSGSGYIPYSEAKEMVLNGLKPLGSEYGKILQHGLNEGRWVDVHPTPNKRNNAYSWGGYGTVPFIMLNYTGSMTEVSTLAHEAGHSMQSHFSNATQPYAYHDYSLFICEVASTVNQILFSDYFLKQSENDQLKLAVLESVYYPMHRYLLVMPMLAEFEDFANNLVETGEGISADTLNGKMLELMAQHYGDSIDLSAAGDKVVGMFWATFSHIFWPGYTATYPAGIAAACQISRDILDEKPQALEKYLSFLKAGSSKYPIDLLLDAGVDINSNEPFNAAAEFMRDYNRQFEHILKVRK